MLGGVKLLGYSQNLATVYMKKKTVRKLDESLAEDLRSISEGSRKKMSKLAQCYLDCVVDPKRSKPARIPSLIGGDPGSTSVIKVKLAGTVFVGTAGFGFIHIVDPFGGGFYSDRVLGHYSAVTFAGTTVASSTATTGCNALSLTASPYTTAQALWSYRLVGLSCEVFPTSSVTNQAGKIGILEPAAHESVVGKSDTDLSTWKRSRLLRGAQLGTVQDKIVGNVHPESFTPDNIKQNNPFEFRKWTTANSTAVDATYGTSLVIWFTGAASVNSYQFEISVVYEFKGKGSPNQKVGLTDERGMNLVLNTFRTKELSGWVGKPEHAIASYYTQTAHIASKVEEGIRRGVDVAKDVLSVARSVGGFFGV